MIRHLLKLVWHRKRANALIVVELFFCFIVVFGVLTGAVTFYSNWRRPLGYDYRNVWDAQADLELEGNPDDDPELRALIHRIVLEARSFPGVVAAAASNTPPFVSSTNSWTRTVNGKDDVRMIHDSATDDYAKVLQIPMQSGRWFSAEDDASPLQAAVIDSAFARELFGDRDPIGQELKYGPDDPSHRIVGVMANYRKDGELSTPVRMLFTRYGPTNEFPSIVRHILIRVSPDAPPILEQQLMEHLQRVASPKISLRLRQLPQLRDDTLRMSLAPLIIGGVIGIFLLSMVALGLTGVLWQSVTRRTREIGLRRAMGASGGAIHRQILLEVLLLATIALALASIVVLQLPVLGAFSVVSRPVFATAFLFALATIYGITLLCGIYPSWLASRLQPADALRYE